MENNQEKFSYTYSASEKSEIEKIRQKYLPREETESKLDTIKRLDESVTRTAEVWALTLGILGTLIMGFGMCIIMTDVGDYLGLAGAIEMAVGISVGIVGIIIAAIAYPVYKAMIKRRREKVAPEILRLTEELMK